MVEALTLFISGCVFGLAGGFTPGPTTTLVVAQTLRFGVLDGMKVAIAPALTDAPIIVASVLLVGQLARFEPVLGVITLLGAGFLFYMAVDGFRVRAVQIDETQVQPRSISKGCAANLLNPHPYLFWFVIGAPTLMKASNAGILAAALFIAGLYFCLVGAKLLVALLVGRSSAFLKSRGYVCVNRLLSLALAGFGVFFLHDALQFLGLV